MHAYNYVYRGNITTPNKHNNNKLSIKIVDDDVDVDANGNIITNNKIAKNANI